MYIFNFFHYSNINIRHISYLLCITNIHERPAALLDCATFGAERVRLRIRGSQAPTAVIVNKMVVPQHAYDASLSKAIARFLIHDNAKSVIDLGAGNGQYSKEFMSHGILTSCYDGNPYTIKLTEGRCAIVDLTKDLNFMKHDWVMSVEVGEHIPAQHEDAFIHNLHRLNKKGMILTWAVVGQGGHGHFNCRNNDYVKEKICALGYTNDIVAEKLLRKSVSNASWIRNTLMVFRRK